ncbi:ANTAR domain-containing protein [Actinomycetospora sp. NBC_00405]|uniref:ANTAR domain-containing protein n=1 Tax=Actinomycetospora sp. NBC_00405 TaxID=2975952 RepID=UPI002E1DEEBD
MDTSDGHDLSWHEDDELHQAEGVLSERLGISMDEAVIAIRRRAEASALTPAEIATQVLHEVRTPRR